MPTPAMTQARLRAWLGHPHISTRCAIGAMRRSKDPYTLTSRASMCDRTYPRQNGPQSPHSRASRSAQTRAFSMHDRATLQLVRLKPIAHDRDVVA